MFGRLASIVAKQLLQGQHVVRTRSEIQFARAGGGSAGANRGRCLEVYGRPRSERGDG